MTHQFNVYKYSNQLVVVITNTVFNDVESILVAPIKKLNSPVITNLQIPLVFDGEDSFVDLLDLATVSKRRLKSHTEQNLTKHRGKIKTGLDLLIDGF